MSEASLKEYIFRWKATEITPAIEVLPSKADSEEEYWKFAKRWLRGALERNSLQVKRWGEVVEVNK